MAHFNFVISHNAKWGHAGFYIDCHRMTVPENILLQKSTVCTSALEMASRGNQHCASCIGTLSFPMPCASLRCARKTQESFCNSVRVNVAIEIHRVTVSRAATRSVATPA